MHLRRREQAFIRHNMTCLVGAPLPRPVSFDPIPPNAVVCGNCELKCLAGPRGIEAGLDGKLPYGLDRMEQSLSDPAKPSDPQRLEDFRQFLKGLVYCVALHPLSGQWEGGGITHKSYWCAGFVPVKS